MSENQYVYNIEEFRWKQRFENYEKAINQLQKGIEHHDADPKDIINVGVIQRFEF